MVRLPTPDDDDNDTSSPVLSTDDAVAQGGCTRAQQDTGQQAHISGNTGFDAHTAQVAQS